MKQAIKKVNKMIEYGGKITLTDSAKKRVQDLIKDEPNGTFLRVYITGGGCSGFQYGFKFDDKIQEDDFSIKEEGADIVVDAMSLQYLHDSILDFTTGLEGSRFIFKNPNAKTKCGCGSSFSI